MKVLSLFDGMSGGQIALSRANIPVEVYFASEIDPIAIQVTQANFPDTVQLGDVKDIQGSQFSGIDLLIGGSPCQGFSFSGHRLNFDDPRSKLFFEFIRLLKECSPAYFLLENVHMTKRHEDIITEYLGVNPIRINSNLVSAQNRERLYWTNIPNIKPPMEQKIVLEDIMESGEKYLEVYDLKNHSPSSLKFIPIKKHTSKVGLICLGGLLRATTQLWLKNGKLLQRNFRQGNRVYSSKGKAPTLNAQNGGLGGKTGLYCVNDTIRRLSRLECERLQTVPEGYTQTVNPNQAITLLGNGWTIDVIAHIFRNIPQKGPCNDG